MSKFQIILIGLFVIFIVVGVITFATYKSNSSDTTLPTVVIWGTFPKSSFSDFVQKLNQTRSSSLSVEYTEIDPRKVRRSPRISRHCVGDELGLYIHQHHIFQRVFGGVPLFG